MAMKIQVDGMTFVEFGKLAQLLEQYSTKITKLADTTYLEFDKKSAFQHAVCEPSPHASLAAVERISF